MRTRVYAIALLGFISLLLPLSCGEPRPEGGDLQVIYGRDDRRDLYAYAPGSWARYWAQSVALVLERSNLASDAKLGYRFTNQKTFAETMLAAGRPLCSTEPFRDQPLLDGICSAFLVAPDRLATAGHCVNEDSCADLAFVFNAGMDSQLRTPGQAAREDVYFCQRVIKSVVNANGTDFAVVQVDRPVTGRRPLRLRTSGFVASQEKLMLIGSPIGLPTKISGEGRILDNSHSAFIRANTDSYAGGSGSAVIGQSSGLVEGVLVRGEQDFVQQGSCWVSKVCPESGANCRGEDIVRAPHFAPYTISSPVGTPNAQVVPPAQAVPPVSRHVYNRPSYAPRYAPPPLARRPVYRRPLPPRALPHRPLPHAPRPHYSSWR